MARQPGGAIFVGDVLAPNRIRHVTDPHLPDGIVKLPPEPGREPSGCGLRGCLIAVVALFALLLVAMVLIALLRPWQTPVVQP